MSNPNNNGSFIGRIAGDPVRFMNQDGSSRVKFQIYADRDFADRKGNVLSDIIPLENYIPAGGSVGPFGRIHKGDLIATSTATRCRPYEKNGETVYPAPTIEVDKLQFLEKKAVTEARVAERVAKGELTLDTDGFAVKGGAQANAAAVAAATDKSA